MKIVRKSSAQATNSSSLDDGHGPPLRTPRRSIVRSNTEESVSFGYKSADFSHMTRQELHDLINCQIRSGQLSLEDSATLAWLTVNVQAEDDSHAVELNEHEPVNFLDSAQSGMEAAKSNGNAVAARQFQNATDIMRRIQGQTIGVDTLV